LTIHARGWYSSGMDSRHYNPNKLKQLRERIGLTQAQVAKMLNVNRQSVYRAESGRIVSYDLLCALCAFYKTEVTELLRPRPLTKRAA
jgi:transcriptional regulator with XRE-family HTH domain